MFYLTRTFKFEAGHRLSNHRGKCRNIHGHNWKVDICVKHNELNEYDMVIDFGDLKNLVNPIIEQLDHRMLFNQEDYQRHGITTMRQMFNGDPTSEVIAKWIFTQMKFVFQDSFNLNERDVQIHSVTVWENDESRVMYQEETNES